MTPTRARCLVLSVVCLLTCVPAIVLGADSSPHIVLLGETLSTFGELPNAAESEDLRHLARNLTVRSLWNEPARFDEHLARYPSGAWTPSLQVLLGNFYRRSGFFTRALGAWSAAWTSLHTRDDPDARRVANDVLGNLIELNAALGRTDTVARLIAEGEPRLLTGHAREQFAGGKQAVWMMTHQPESSFRCGPVALARVLRKARAGSGQALHQIDAYASTVRGTSLAMLQSLAAEHGIDVVPIRRRRGSKIPVPSIIHWRSGHFAALVDARDGFVEVVDPTFGQSLRMPDQALEDESSGHCLVLGTNAIARGWSRMARVEAEQVWGKGNTGNSDPGGTTENHPKKPPKPKCPKPPPTPTPPPLPPVVMGMAEHDAHLGVVSLNLEDTPVVYVAPRGPAIPFTVTYNSREAYQPSAFNFSNLGGRWVTNWIAYVEDNPSIVGGTVRLAERGGGSYFYSGYNASTRKYAVNRHGNYDTLQYGGNAYVRFFHDGSREVYNVPSSGGSTTVRRLLLSQVIDPNGNTLTLLYDQSFGTRLTAIRDVLGRSMTIEYGLPGDPYKITRVVDPFGRAATFAYTDSRLATITDTIGIVSRFDYGPTADAPTLPLDFINQMVTPYGVTRFRMGESGTRRWLESTEPSGDRERVEFISPAPGIDSSTTHVPAGFTNNYLQYRNTFYWNSRAMQSFSEADPERYRRATVIYHWLHNGTGANALASSEAESILVQGQRRVWFAYPGQPDTLNQGTLSAPSVIARVLDDGSEERETLQYTTGGQLQRYTDPMGRRYRMVWDFYTNDLLWVFSDSDSAPPDRLAQFTYDDRHRPIRYVDQAGQTWQYTYNTYGQLRTITGPNGSVTEVIYNAVGLPEEVNQSGVNRHLFTWDARDLLATWTDPIGLTMTFQYDDLDRITAISFPDGTSEQYFYDRFELVEMRDRHGGVVSYAYDLIGNLISVRDRAGRSLRLEWCGCGNLEKLTDERGIDTIWLRDELGRVTAKYVAQRLIHDFTWDSAGRLVRRRDGKRQVKHFEYDRDGRLRRVSYTNTTAPTPTVEYFYNNRYPRLDRSIDGIGETIYTWHPAGVLGAGRIASIDGPFANDVVTFQYDFAGRPTNIAVNNVENVQTYDSLGRVTMRRNALGTFIPSYNGTTQQITGIAYPNGQRVRYSWYGGERLFQLQSIKSEVLRDGTWEPLSSFTYDYLLNGLTAISTITSMTVGTNDAEGERQTTFAYDAAWQLVRSDTTWTTQKIMTFTSAFQYDPAGNRISEEINGIISLASHDDLNRLTSILRQIDQPLSTTISANQQKVRALSKPPAMQPERRNP